jgi:hypothetical protein
MGDETWQHRFWALTGRTPEEELRLNWGLSGGGAEEDRVNERQFDILSANAADVLEQLANLNKMEVEYDADGTPVHLSGGGRAMRDVEALRNSCACFADMALCLKTAAILWVKKRLEVRKLMNRYAPHNEAMLARVQAAFNRLRVTPFALLTITNEELALTSTIWTTLNKTSDFLARYLTASNLSDYNPHEQLQLTQFLVAISTIIVEFTDKFWQSRLDLERQVKPLPRQARRRIIPVSFAEIDTKARAKNLQLVQIMSFPYLISAFLQDFCGGPISASYLIGEYLEQMRRMDGTARTAVEKFFTPSTAAMTLMSRADGMAATLMAGLRHTYNGTTGGGSLQTDWDDSDGSGALEDRVKELALLQFSARRRQSLVTGGATKLEYDCPRPFRGSPWEGHMHAALLFSMHMGSKHPAIQDMIANVRVKNEAMGFVERPADPKLLEQAIAAAGFRPARTMLQRIKDKLSSVWSMFKWLAGLVKRGIKYIGKLFVDLALHLVSKIVAMPVSGAKFVLRVLASCLPYAAFLWRGTQDGLHFEQGRDLLNRVKLLLPASWHTLVDTAQQQMQKSQDRLIAAVQQREVKARGGGFMDWLTAPISDASSTPSSPSSPSLPSSPSSSVLTLLSSKVCKASASPMTYFLIQKTSSIPLPKRIYQSIAPLHKFLPMALMLEYMSGCAISKNTLNFVYWVKNNAGSLIPNAVSIATGAASSLGTAVTSAASSLGTAVTSAASSLSMSFMSLVSSPIAIGIMVCVSLYLLVRFIMWCFRRSKTMDDCVRENSQKYRRITDLVAELKAARKSGDLARIAAVKSVINTLVHGVFTDKRKAVHVRTPLSETEAQRADRYAQGLISRFANDSS